MLGFSGGNDGVVWVKFEHGGTVAKRISFQDVFHWVLFWGVDNGLDFVRIDHTGQIGVGHDVLGYFAAYGQIEDVEWLEEPDKSDSSVEEMRLHFAASPRVSDAMRKHKHQIMRESDGKEIAVKVCVKFSDNVVT